MKSPKQLTSSSLHTTSCKPFNVSLLTPPDPAPLDVAPRVDPTALPAPELKYVEDDEAIPVAVVGF